MDSGTARALSTTQKEAWDRRELSPPECIAPDVWVIPVPIPGGPMVSTLCYALLSPGGAVHLVDPGWDSDEGLTAITDGLGAAGRSLSDVRSVLATHFHPDHLGMAPRIRDLTGAEVMISATEFEVLQQESNRTDRDRSSHQRQLEAWGVPEQRQREALEFYRMPYLPADFHPDLQLEHGQRLDLEGHHLEVVLTPGHTSGHTCLIDAGRGLVYAGDHLLPRIFAGVGLGMLPGTDPLDEFMRALDDVSQEPTYRVLPGHEYCFSGVVERTEEIRSHHLTRTQEVADLIDTLGEASVWEYARRLTWSAGWERTQGFFLDSALRQTALHVEFVRSGRAAPHLERLKATKDER